MNKCLCDLKAPHLAWQRTCREGLTQAFEFLHILKVENCVLPKTRAKWASLVVELPQAMQKQAPELIIIHVAT